MRESNPLNPIQILNAPVDQLNPIQISRMPVDQLENFLRLRSGAIPDDKLYEICKKTAENKYPIDYYNYELFCRIYETMGNIHFKHSEFANALKFYELQAKATLDRVSNIDDPNYITIKPRYITPHFRFSEALCKIAKTKCVLGDFDNATKLYLKAWNAVDNVIELRNKRNEDSQTYEIRSNIYSGLIESTKTQNQDLLSQLSLGFADIHKPCTKTGTMEKINAFYKLSLSFQIYAFLADHNFKINNNQESIKFTELLLKNIEQYEQHKIAEARLIRDKITTLNPSSQSVFEVCNIGMKISEQNQNSHEFNKYFLKELEYFDENCTKEMVDQAKIHIGNFRPQNENEFKIVYNAINYISDFTTKQGNHDEAIQLYESFKNKIEEFQSKSPLILKITADTYRKISQTYNKKSGDDENYKKAIGEEYIKLVELVNIISTGELKDDMQNFNHSDRFKIFQRASEISTLLDKKDDKIKFESLKRTIPQQQFSIIDNESLVPRQRLIKLITPKKQNTIPIEQKEEWLRQLKLNPAIPSQIELASYALSVRQNPRYPQMIAPTGPALVSAPHPGVIRPNTQNFDPQNPPNIPALGVVRGSGNSAISGSESAFKPSSSSRPNQKRSNNSQGQTPLDILANVAVEQLSGQPSSKIQKISGCKEAGGERSTPNQL